MDGRFQLALPIRGPRLLWNKYCQSLAKRPVLTKSATSLVGFALGDAIAQLSNRPRKRDRHTQPWGFDTYRTVRLATYGGLVAGPLGHYWFSFLDASVYASSPKSIKAIASKICLDQVLMTPLGTSLFFAFAKIMDGQPGAVISTLKILQEAPFFMQEKLLPTCEASVKLWPAAHLINFAFVPSSQRLLYINVISIFWTVLLSKAATQGIKTEAIASSPPMLVVVPVTEDEVDSLASISFLDEMEAMETEYDRD